MEARLHALKRTKLYSLLTSLAHYFSRYELNYITAAEYAEHKYDFQPEHILKADV